MKLSLILTAVVAASMAACGGETAGNIAPVAAPNTAAAVPPPPAPSVSIPNDGDYSGRGKVTKVNLELGSVELDHEEINGVMPAMIMEIYVSDKSILDGLKVGDQVDFVLRYKHPTETIVKITKIQ